MKLSVRTVPAVPAYFAHVDGLRALAVLAVMLYHLHPARLPGGFVGVDVFFVISGFVVTASLAGHRDEHAGAFLALFYARRLARLMPALVTMLVATTALYVLFVPKAWFNRAAETVGQAAFWGLSNWTLDRQIVNYVEPRAEWNPFTHTWSLGVEEQFYLIAPLLLFVALGTRFVPRLRMRAAAVIAALAVLSFVACHYFGLTKGSRFVFYQLTFRFWELACGVLLFLAGQRIGALSDRFARLHRWSGWIGLGLVLATMVAPKPQAFPWARATVAVFGTMLLIGLPTVERPDRLRPVLASPAALWIGHRSYALYLWHWPVYVLARWTTGLSVWPFNLLAVGVSFVAAAVSYRWIENPVRHSAALRRWHPATRIPAFVLLLAAGWWGGQTLLDAQPRLGLGQPTRQAADWYGDRNLFKTQFTARRSCEPRIARARLDDMDGAVITYLPDTCSERATQQLFVLGDSHAVAYLPMLEQLSAEQGRVVIVVQAPGCAYLDLMAPMDASGDPRCLRLAQAAMKTVLDQSRPGDIVFLPSLRLPRLIELGGATRPGARAGESSRPVDPYAHSPEELRSIRAASIDAPRWLIPLLDARLRILFELPKPVFRAHAFQCVDWFNRDNPVCAGGLSERRTDQERYRKPVVEVIQRFATEHLAVATWDPLPALCDERSCDALVSQRPLFFDGDHVSPYGNAVLLPLFALAVQGLADGLPRESSADRQAPPR